MKYNSVLNISGVEVNTDRLYVHQSHDIVLTVVSALTEQQELASW